MWGCAVSVGTLRGQKRAMDFPGAGFPGSVSLLTWVLGAAQFLCKSSKQPANCLLAAILIS